MTKRHVSGLASAALIAASLCACNPTTPAKPAVDTGKIADAVKADATQIVADYNAHDPAKFVSHLAGDDIAMFHGAPNDVGVAATQADLKQTFAATPDVHVTLAGQTADVAASGDMAVFRSTYTVTFTNPKTKQPITENGNYLVGYRLQPDGSWKQTWSVVSDIGPPAKAAPAAKS